MDYGHRAVAVPARLSDGDDADPRIAGANRIFHDVVALVRLQGLEPVVVEDAATDLSNYAGLVLPGGGDIDPARYGGHSSTTLYDVNPVQDELDFRLAGAAIAAGIPVLGICRGAQVLNVACGGTLIEDLPPSEVTHYHLPDVAEELDFVWHAVEVRAGTRLADRLGRGNATVASGHHQGIDRLGDGLVASAVAADGLVEAFEDEAGLLVGVQWHPEAPGTEPSVRDAQFVVFAAAIADREQEVLGV